MFAVGKTGVVSVYLAACAPISTPAASIPVTVLPDPTSGVAKDALIFVTSTLTSSPDTTPVNTGVETAAAVVPFHGRLAMLTDIVIALGATVKERSTAAATKGEATDALNEQVPGATMLTVPPETVHTPVVSDDTTAEAGAEAVAPALNAASP